MVSSQLPMIDNSFDPTWFSLNTTCKVFSSGFRKSGNMGTGGCKKLTDLSKISRILENSFMGTVFRNVLKNLRNFEVKKITISRRTGNTDLMF